MKQNVVKIKLHGHLGEAIGKEWSLAVKSIREAVHAINTLTKGKLNKYLLQKNKEGAEYKFMINDSYIKGSRLTESNAEKAFQSELVMNFKSLKTLDIIPIIEGADKNLLGGLLTAIGVILIVIGIVALVAGGSGTLLIMAGLTLLAGGVSLLLTKSPHFAPFNNIATGSSGRSYFFGGAVNITTEGGPVPMGYGEAVVGSQVISAGYSVGIRTDSLPHAQNTPGGYLPFGTTKGGNVVPP